MLFEYLAPDQQLGSLPLNAEMVWSQSPLQPLSPGALTPFSYSVLAELASRAWYVHYDRLGFDPTPRSKVVRRYRGRVYFNLSLSAQLEATHAGLEPLSLHVNGKRQPLATWEKPGFLAGFKLGRAQKKIDETLAEYARQIGAITEKARAWYLKTQGINRWGQAEVLQIMEEIERIGVDSMVAFLAARLNLLHHYARLARQLADNATPVQAGHLINCALGDIAGLVETEMLNALPRLADALRAPAAQTWLRAGQFADWRTTLPTAEAVERIQDFLGSYGHRAVHEGEIALPRWSEDVSLLMAASLAHIEDAPRPAATAAAPTKAHAQSLLALLPASGRKQGEHSLQQIAALHKLQSSALHALAYIGAGTRSWALAAAREAMVDKRLHSQDEVFLFELEEIKQMMTGEWNISSLDEIRTTTATRRAEHAAIQSVHAPDILVGEAEAFVSHRGVPGVTGRASGPLSLWQDRPAPPACDVVLATPLLDSGCTLALPLARAFVAAAGTPCDPFVVAAHSWPRPVVIGMGKSFDELVEGTMTVVDINGDVSTDVSDAVTVTQVAAPQGSK